MTDKTSIQSLDESASGIHWWNVTFFILVVVGFFLVATAFAAYCIDKRRRAAIKVTTTGQTTRQNVEAQTSAAVTTAPSSSFPYGPFTLLPTLAAAIGLALSVIVNTMCDFVSLDERSDGELLSVGIWSVSYDFNPGGNTCSSEYPQDFNMDAAIRCSRVASILAATIGGISLLTYLFARGKLGTFRRWMSLPLVLATISQALTLSLTATEWVRDSNGLTELDFGGIASIFATAYWFIAAITMLVIPLNESVTVEK